MSARFVTAKVLGSLATLAFVVAFNFFLFRVVEGDPVASLFRGRNLSQSQRAELTKQFGLDGSTGEQFVRYLGQTAQLNLGRSYIDEPAGATEIWRKAGPTIALVGISTLLSTVFGVMIGIAAAWRRRTKTDYSATTFTMATYAMPDFWLGMLLLIALRGRRSGWFPVGGIVDPTPTRPAWRSSPTRPSTCSCRALTLTLAYLGEYALVMRSSLLETMREDYLVLARAKGLRDIAGAQPPRGAERAAAGGDADRDQLRLRPVRARSRSRRSSPGRASGWRPTTRSRAPTCRCSRACSSSSAPRSSSPTCSPTCSTPTSTRGCGRMSAVAVPSARRITWLRRRRALARAWREYRRHTPGMIGLAILVARRGAWRSPRRCWPTPPACTRSTRPPTRRGPTRRSSARWAPTTSGAACSTQFVWGARISLLVGLAATVLAMLDRLAGRDRRGLLRRLDRGASSCA